MAKIQNAATWSAGEDVAQQEPHGAFPGGPALLGEAAPHEAKGAPTLWPAVALLHAEPREQEAGVCTHVGTRMLEQLYTHVGTWMLEQL